MREILSQVKGLTPGDLVQVEWTDASIGKSLSNGIGGIDVPVKSWGIFIGLLGEKAKHIVLAQNSFRYADGLFDLDYTAIPLSWTVDIQVLAKEHVPKQLADKLVNSFLMARGRAFSNQRTFQQRLSTHGRPD